jgi:hypothetical protein
MDFRLVWHDYYRPEFGMAEHELERQPQDNVHFDWCEVGQGSATYQGLAGG